MSFPPVAAIAGPTRDAPPVAALWGILVSPAVSPLGFGWSGIRFIGIHLGLALSDRLGTEFLAWLSGLVVPEEMGGGALH